MPQALVDADSIGVHPNRNDQTITMAPADLLKFVKHFGHEPSIVKFDGLSSSPAAPADSKPKALKPKSDKPTKQPPSKDAGKVDGADSKGLTYTKAGNFPKW